jgi:hypothetical protein
MVTVLRAGITKRGMKEPRERCPNQPLPPLPDAAHTNGLESGIAQMALLVLPPESDRPRGILERTAQSVGRAGPWDSDRHRAEAKSCVGLETGRIRKMRLISA